MQYKVCDLLRKPQRARMSNTKTQPPEVGACELGGDIAYPVVAPVAAALFKPNIARGDVEFVVDHENLFWGDLMKARDSRDCRA